MERSVKNFIGGLKLVYGTKLPTSPLFHIWIKTNICLIRMKGPQFIEVSSPIEYKGDIQLNTGVEEIQQLNPGEPDPLYKPSHL